MRISFYACELIPVLGATAMSTTTPDASWCER